MTRWTVAYAISRSGMRTPLVHALASGVSRMWAEVGREVIDRVRVDEANRLRHDRPARKVVQGARWLLLRNRGNLKPSDRVRLNELLKANRRLATVYILKDDLKHVWDFEHRTLRWGTTPASS